jgi:hypothetical protein
LIKTGEKSKSEIMSILDNFGVWHPKFTFLPMNMSHMNFAPSLQTEKSKIFVLAGEK